MKISNTSISISMLSSDSHEPMNQDENVASLLQNVNLL